jgi:hypothetical protein
LGNNGTLLLQSLVTVSNPGYYSLSQLKLSVALSLPSQAPFLRGGSPVTDVSGGHTGVVPLNLLVPLNSLGPASSLLTNDTQLTAATWFNATYALFFPVRGFASTNFSWGAPFAGMVNTLRGVAPLSNGSARVMIETLFQNHASFADDGTFSFVLKGQSGMTCTQGSMVVFVPSGQSFDQISTFYVPSTCGFGGGTILPSFSGQGFNLKLPTVTVP